ncbi:MAG: GSCFA domain-containing protein [Desulfobacterales bacterium]|nr:MAG: GSCFA domain-containing protein [Desulfobacterales bacterium]
MARSDVHPIHRFEPWQVWPGSFDNPPVDGVYPIPQNIGLKITRSTPIASMGSCFAREIKRKLLQRKYNYISEESHHPAAIHASAAWERVYSTFCMRQIFEYTFEQWEPGLRWWIAPQSKKVQDPYRRTIVYNSIEEAEADFAQHLNHSRQALQRAEVLILTLGLTEIWQDRVDGSVISLPSGPYVKEGGDMDRYGFRVSRYTENLENLERIHEIMAKHNPGCKLLMTVSPVNLWATFRKDLDVISASCNSKSTLRAVTDEFTFRHDNVYYFPAFEMATIYQPLSGLTYFSDGRENYHVNKPTVKFIMRHFFDYYSKPQES